MPIARGSRQRISPVVPYSALSIAMAIRRIGVPTNALWVQDSARTAGLNPHQFAGYSLRAGLVSAAGLVDITDIMPKAGHKRMYTVLKYVRGKNVREKRMRRGGWNFRIINDGLCTFDHDSRTKAGNRLPVERN